MCEVPVTNGRCVIRSNSARTWRVKFSVRVGSPPVTPPITGSQSWLFFPLISVGLFAEERIRGVLPHSERSRVAVPGFHLRGTTSNSTVNSCFLCFRNVMWLLHCQQIGNMVVICQHVSKNCAHQRTSWQHFAHDCLRSVTGSSIVVLWSPLQQWVLMFQRQRLLLFHQRLSLMQCMSRHPMHLLRVRWTIRCHQAQRARFGPAAPPVQTMCLFFFCGVQPLRGFVPKR